jgi:hypothetical protein
VVLLEVCESLRYVALLLEPVGKCEVGGDQLGLRVERLGDGETLLLIVEHLLGPLDRGVDLASVCVGLDLEMPGPARACASLPAEAEADEATPAAVRTAARNVLRLIERTSTFDRPRDVSTDAERAEEYTETRALIRRAGAKVAVVGPNVATAPT